MKVSVKHLTVKNQCLPIYSGKIRAMLQCIKTFPSKIKDIDFTRGNPKVSRRLGPQHHARGYSVKSFLIGTQQPRGFSLIPPNQVIAIAMS